MIIGEIRVHWPTGAFNNQTTSCKLVYDKKLSKMRQYQSKAGKRASVQNEGVVIQTIPIDTRWWRTEKGGSLSQSEYQTRCSEIACTVVGVANGAKFDAPTYREYLSGAKL